MYCFSRGTLCVSVLKVDALARVFWQDEPALVRLLRMRFLCYSLVLYVFPSITNCVIVTVPMWRVSAELCTGLKVRMAEYASGSFAMRRLCYCFLCYVPYSIALVGWSPMSCVQSVRRIMHVCLNWMYFWPKTRANPSNSEIFATPF